MSSNQLTTKEKIYQDFVPAGISAGLSLGIYGGILGESIMEPTQLMGMSVPTGLLVAGTVFVSHLLSNVLEFQVLKITGSSGEDAIAKFVKPAISGASTYGMFFLANGQGTDFMYSFGIGAASNFGGQFLHDQFFKKMY